MQPCSASCTHITAIALRILLYAYVCLLANGFLFSFQGKLQWKELSLKSNTEGLLYVKEDIDKEDYMRYSVKNFNMTLYIIRF